MNVIDILNNQQIYDLEPSVACIGYFDGLHKGHMALISKTLEIAKEKNLKSALITFDPDPWTIVHNQKTSHITTIEDRTEICQQLGFDQMFIIRFDQAFSQVEPEDFLDILIQHYQVKHLVCGFDFRYGRFGKGNRESLMDHCSPSFEVTIIEEVIDHTDKISSSLIIDLIKEGEMEKVTSLLTRPYQIKGIVVAGSQIGRQLGFPTANLSFSDEYVMPKTGVYFGYTLIAGESYPSLINVGYNPTTNQLKHISIESYLLDFSQDLYDQTITLQFTHYHRGELALNSLDELVTLMKHDEKISREYFAN